MVENQKRILGINTQLDYYDYPGLVCESIRSAISFLDYDTVIIDTRSISENYMLDYPYEGKPLITKDDSPKIVDDFRRIKDQIEEMLNHGKNIFVILSNNENCYIHTGKYKYDGTGKNARKTDYVQLFDTFSFIPIEIDPTLIQGEKFCIACNPPYSTFFNATKDILYYELYFEAPQETQLLLTPNKTKTISAVYKIGRGNIVLLPCVDIDIYESEDQWIEKAKLFLDALLELNNSLSNNTGKYVLPLWSDSIKMPDETLAEEKLEKDCAKLKKLEENISKQKEQLNKIKDLKKMITASGAVLEEIVKTVLVSIGFTLQKSEVGRSDVIALYNDLAVVAEIKGVSKSAAEKHATQLEKWVSQYYEENDHMPKALLIVNGFCDTPLTERKEEVFPDQMLNYCSSRGHALITTTQLLCMYIEIMKDPSCAQERVHELFSCVGKYQRYLDYEKYLEIIS